MDDNNYQKNLTPEDSVNSPICLPGSVRAEVDDLVEATELAVVVRAESKKKQADNRWCPTDVLSLLLTTNSWEFTEKGVSTLCSLILILSQFNLIE